MQQNTKKKKNVLGKAPPHNIEAEKALLCCAMIDINAPVQILPVLGEEDFYAPAHKDIFRAMSAVYSANKPVDFVTVVTQLSLEDKLERAGGLEYISAINIALPSAANFKHYLSIVKQLSTNRKLITSCNDIIELAYFPYDEDRQNEEISVLTHAEKKIYDLAMREQRSPLTPIELALNQSIGQIEKLSKNPNALRGISTPFPTLNGFINGLNKGDLIVIAARPGVGKTSLVMNLVEYAALSTNRKNEIGEIDRYSAAVFSLEMPANQLATRVIASVGGVNLKKLNRGELTQSDWRLVFNAKNALKDAKIYIDDNSLITPMELLSKCRRLKREVGLDLIAIDYLQLMSVGRRVENRVNEISEITRMLKIAAKELEVPILLLSQLNREVEKRGKSGVKMPQLSDLRESGSIEQDADIVMFIEKDGEIGEDKCEAVLRVAKNRNGPTGALRLLWEGSFVRFTETSSAKRERDQVRGDASVAPNNQAPKDNTIGEVIEGEPKE